MVRWEYKVLPRARAIQAPEAGRQWYGATDWDPADFIDQLPKLGQDGWELVAITSRSNLAHATAPVAGWTSQEVWVFKRPIDGGEGR
jgi:hypothetical protein